MLKLDRGRLLLLLACALMTVLVLPTLVQAEVVVKLVEYNGWSNSVELTNDLVRVVVVPSVGRVMFYGLKGGENLLWENPEFAGKTLVKGEYLREEGKPVWANFGGDKVWPTQQDNFPKVNGIEWPPDPWFDGSPFRAALLPDGVRLTSQVSDYCGARIRRVIRLDPAGPGLSVTQKMEKVRIAQRESVEPLPLTIWSITQVVYPEQVLVPLNPESALEKGFHVFPFESRAANNFKVENGTGVFTPHEEYSQKVGADSDHWLGAVIGQMAMAILFTRVEGLEYPDGGLSTEVYTSPDYTELEILSPLTVLQPGESFEWNVRWVLTELAAETPEGRRAEVLTWITGLLEDVPAGE